MPGEMNPIESSAGGADDIDRILAGTSGTDPAQSAGDEAAAAPKDFTWGGRKYANRETAEKASNATYGEYSKQRELINRLKSLAGRDPEAFARLSQDKEWREILGKLGIEIAETGLAEEENAAEAAGSPQYEELLEQIGVERATMALEREEQRFERELKRPLTDEEHNAVMKVLRDAPSLTYAQAFKLAHHDRIVADVEKRAAEASRAKSPVKRPVPGIPQIPGMRVDTRKKPEDMTEAEWRENVKNSPELQRLLSRE